MDFYNISINEQRIQTVFNFLGKASTSLTLSSFEMKASFDPSLLTVLASHISNFFTEALIEVQIISKSRISYFKMIKKAILVVLGFALAAHAMHLH